MKINHNVIIIIFENVDNLQVSLIIRTSYDKPIFVTYLGYNFDNLNSYTPD